MEWIYNSRSGAVQQYPSAIAKTLLSSGTGWHGPFDSKEAALAFYTSNKANNPGWKEPTGIPGQIANLPGAVLDQNVAAAKGTLGLSDEEIRSWFIRIGEVLLGIVLIGVGLAKLTGTTNAIANIVKAKVS